MRGADIEPRQRHDLAHGAGIGGKSEIIAIVKRPDDNPKATGLVAKTGASRGIGTELQALWLADPASFRRRNCQPARPKLLDLYRCAGQFLQHGRQT